MLECICGSAEYKEFKRDNAVVVDPKGELKPSDIGLVACSKCGLIRQKSLPYSTQDEYHKYYEDYPPTQTDYIKKDYRHDRELAVKRCLDYEVGDFNRGIVLDVGSGSGAFVDECRNYAVEAFGCEISKYHYEQNEDYIYRDDLLNINFPTDNFDLVTCHDVVEHVLNPIEFLSELFRITKQFGTCIIDLPNFFHLKSDHHWKSTEHIWFFTVNQFEKLLTRIGFEFQSTRHPIPTKTVFRLIKPIQKRPKILLPPGIGDSFWSIVKMQSFLKSKGLSLPDCGIAAGRDKRDKYKGHIRSVPFLKLFPFINATEDFIPMKKMEDGKDLWREAYADKGRTIFENIYGFDYLLSYNGNLRHGKKLKDIDPDLECNWYPPMFVSLDQSKFKEKCIKQYGKYICVYLPLYGHYTKWLKEFSLDDIIKSINRITRENGTVPVLMGAQWDADDVTLQKAKKKIKKLVDLIGKTTIDQAFGCLTGSQLVIGFPSGLTIMATVLKCKTLMIWNDFYKVGNPNNKFYKNACPPDTLNNTYLPVNTSEISIKSLSGLAKKIMTGHSDNYNENPPTSPPVVEKQQIKRMRAKRKPKNIPRHDLTIACVLKSGDGFSIDYVKKLKNMVARNTSLPHEFICLSDLEIDPSICRSLKLNNDFNKLELFKSGQIDSRRIIYFNLDIVILSNIDDLLSMNVNFISLRPWNRTNQLRGFCGTGLMSWRNDGQYSFIHDDFISGLWKKYPHGEKEYIAKTLIIKGHEPAFFQDHFNGIYSYKRGCRISLPGNARIVCFHGRPKPHMLDIPWILENWR